MRRRFCGRIFRCGGGMRLRAEDAVRNSKSYSEGEALRLGLIEVVAADDASLLAQLDRRTVKRFGGATEVLHLAGARVVVEPPSVRERLLSRLTSADLDVLLLVFGGAADLPGVQCAGNDCSGRAGDTDGGAGAVWAEPAAGAAYGGVAAAGGAGADAAGGEGGESWDPGGGGGWVPGVFGLATLVDGPVDGMRVHAGTALGAGVGFGVVTFGLAWVAWRARRNKRLLGPEAMVGMRGVVLRALEPAGQVEVRGEIWSAVVASGVVGVGAAVTVRRVEGLVLVVEG